MNNNKLEIKAKIQIQKPVGEVFEAIVNPEKMADYFIAKGTESMETGAKPVWKFPEFDDEVPVSVSNVEKDKYVAFYWDNEGVETLCEINLSAVDTGETIVEITEKEMDNTEAGIKWLKGNTEGWANFLCCLKAYLEYGINLRKGAFDYYHK